MVQNQSDNINLSVKINYGRLMTNIVSFFSLFLY